MFKGNAQLRRAGEAVEYTPEMVKEVIRCQQDILYFAEHYYHIITLDGGKVLIPLRDFQKKILKVYTSTDEDKRHSILLVPRQSGKSTIVTLFALHYALFNPDKLVAILANKQSIAVELLKKIKLAYENLPLWLQKGINDDGWNSLSLGLENGSRIIASSTSSASISGMSVNVLILDEFAKVPSHVAEDFITSTYPVISAGKTSKIMMISTAKGLNHFYDFFQGAIKKKNGYFPMKVRYDEVPGRDAKWKKDTIKHFGLKRFQQEFGNRFFGSSSTLVDSDVLERCDILEPIEIKWKGAFLIYEQPIPKQLYILGIDSAKGVGADYSVVQVLKILNNGKMEQAAVYRDNLIGTHDFADVCISISKYYNGCMMMLENNAEGGEVAQTIWYEREYDRICNLENKGLGIRSDKKSKMKMNLCLKDYFDNGNLKVVDKETINELGRYAEVSPNIFKSESNDVNDDLVTSLGWGVLFVKTPYFDGTVEVREADEEYLLDNNEDEEPFNVVEPPPMQNQISSNNGSVNIFGNQYEQNNEEIPMFF